MKTLKDCRNLYLKRDFLLFANVFEKFRNRCLENYSFCPSHLSAPALIWDVMLSMTKVKVYLIPVVDMCLLFKKGMRDIISYISKRYSRANNKYLTSYSPKKPTKHMRYLGKNNLHDYAMLKSLPIGLFKCLDPAKFNWINMMITILEVLF